tara:strand:- start:2068 stop:2388 length:321 start_codon:yes stop_codon:yes gene_type:complete
MKIFKILIVLSFIFFLTSCGTVKEGFKNQKKNNTDEFLVEKKSPLVMPPDYNQLPMPNKESNQIENDDNSIKKLVINDKNTTKNSNTKGSEGDALEESILEKIKSN